MATPLTIALGADHAGLELKNALGRVLRDRGYTVLDLGTNATDSVDYPDFGAKVGRAVAADPGSRGLLACGSGIGIAMAANKVPGARAAAVWDEESARLSRQHNDANGVSVGERLHRAATREVQLRFKSSPREVRIHDPGWAALSECPIDRPVEFPAGSVRVVEVRG